MTHKSMSYQNVEQALWCSRFFIQMKLALKKFSISFGSNRTCHFLVKCSNLVRFYFKIFLTSCSDGSFRKISETATYAFDSVDSCEPSRSVMKVPGPEFVYNAGGVSLIYQVRKFLHNEDNQWSTKVQWNIF